MENTTKINYEEMKTNPVAVTRESIELALQPYRQARELLENACAAFKKDANKEDAGINNRRKELTGKLYEIEHKAEVIVSRLPAASIVGGKELETLEDELDDINTEATKLKRRISQIDKAENAGSNQLYLEVSEAYKNLQKADLEKVTSLNEIIAISRRWSEFYEEINKEASKASRYGMGSREKPGDISFIRITEQHLGPIDVKGHTCGTDDGAKARYVRGLGSGSFRGLENTPAYKSWREQNGGMDDSPEQLDRAIEKQLTEELPVAIAQVKPQNIDVLCGWGKKGFDND